MYAQTAYFKSSAANWNSLLKRISQWKADHADSTPGLADLTATRNDETGSSTVSVIFTDKHHLDTFATHPATLAFFEDASPLADGHIEYYDAHCARLSLL